MSDLNEALFVAVDDFVRRAVKPLLERIDAQEKTITELEAELEAVAEAMSPASDIVALRALVDTQGKTIEDCRSGLAERLCSRVDQRADEVLNLSYKELQRRLDDPAEVKAMVDAAVQAIPKPKDGNDGTSIDVAEVRAMVGEAVKALPVPKDGKSVEMAEVVALVETAVKALPVPKNGENGTSVDVAEVRAMVADAVKALPVPKNGENGKSIDPADVRAMVADAVKAIPVPKNGTDGTSVSVDQVRELVETAVNAIPVPKDGDPGKKGGDGVSVTDATIDSDGLLLLTLSDGRLLRTSKVIGERGRPGDKGADANPEMVKAVVDATMPGLVDDLMGESLRTLEARVDAWLPEIKRDAKGESGKDGIGKQGEPGDSAYAIAKTAGFSGSEADWLLSLRGKDGVATNGKDGRSAVEIAREHGFAGSDLDWLVSLHGKDGDDGSSILSALVDSEGELVLTASDGTRHRAGVVKGRDGDDGDNGKDGVGLPGRDAVAIRLLPAIDDAKSYPAGSWAVHAGGSWYAEQATEPLAGRSPQKAGWMPTAVGEQSFSIELLDDLRTIVTKRVTSTGLTLERRWKIPTLLDRGVFTAGKQYERGDQVTTRNSYFIAKVDKPAGVPGTDGANDWRMSIKGAKP